MRTLKSKDLFAALRVVKEINIKDEMLRISEALSGNDEDIPDLDKLKNEIGLELLIGVLGNCGSEKAEKAIYAFLSGPLETPAEDLREMDLIEQVDMIKDMIRMNESEKWKAFFTSLADLIRRL